jgi:hypothetical protein
MYLEWSLILKPTGIPIRAEEIVAFEADLGVPLANDYRAFLLSFNGGKVVADHVIHLPTFPWPIAIHNLWALSVPTPSLGIVEARKLQLMHRLCVREALTIGDDGGTGCFYLVVAGPQKGAVFFVFKEDQIDCVEDWLNPADEIPRAMAKVSDTFDGLAKMIRDSASGRPAIW